MCGKDELLGTGLGGGGVGARGRGRCYVGWGCRAGVVGMSGKGLGLGWELCGVWVYQCIIIWQGLGVSRVGVLEVSC